MKTSFLPHPLALPALLLITLSACSEESGASAPTVSIEVDGTKVVSSSDEDRPLPWRFQEVHRIGGTNAGPEAFFGIRATGIETLDSEIFVLDAGNNRVVVFDSLGTHLRSFGSQGDGPGEIRTPIAITLAPDGRAWIRDLQKPTLVAFDASGLPAESVPLLPMTTLIRFHRSGFVFEQIARNPKEGERTTGLKWGSGSDSLLIASVSTPTSGMVMLESCPLSVRDTKIFFPRLRWTATDSEVAFSTGVQYEVTLLRDGAESLVVRRSVTPFRATQELALAELGPAQIITTSNGSTLTCAAEEMLEKRGYAELVPTISELRLGPRFLWIQRKVPGDASGPIDIFSRTGEYLGTLPPGSPFPAAFLGSDRIIVTEKDELDVDYVVIYRISGHIEGN